MAAKVALIDKESTSGKSKDNAQGLLRAQAANELVFAVVGHVGSGTSTIAKALQGRLETAGDSGLEYQARVISAREVIEDWAKGQSILVPAKRTEGDSPKLVEVEAYQDLGDRMRWESGDHSAVAIGMIEKIQEVRSEIPEGERATGKRAYILDSIRHPGEVELLRHVYQDAFILVGVVCTEEIRSRRITSKYADAGMARASEFMARDAKAGPSHGQRTSAAFHLADFFAENSEDRFIEDGGRDEVENPDWLINDSLKRLFEVVVHPRVVRPTAAETGMHHAYSAQLRSSCLSRQVGAALLDKTGNILATGTNEAPRAGGGVYGEEIGISFDTEADEDHRCAFMDTPFCSNTKEQKKIIDDLLKKLPEYKGASAEKRDEAKKILMDSQIGDLLEYSRAIHAEMDAILSASRAGASTIGSHLFVTTFPCHYCARHIVSSGVDEVQYIEPYPKSAALQQHSDAIEINPKNWKPPSEDGKKVLFRPFSGVAPRLYRRAFLKDRELKNKETGDFEIQEPEMVHAWHLRKLSYVDLENLVLGKEERDGS